VETLPEELVAIRTRDAVEVEEGFTDGFESLEVVDHVVFIFHNPL
jgi:tRNA (Thr-GGU) A37 N-methylase